MFILIFQPPSILSAFSFLVFDPINPSSRVCEIVTLPRLNVHELQAPSARAISARTGSLQGRQLQDRILIDCLVEHPATNPIRVPFAARLSLLNQNATQNSQQSRVIRHTATRQRPSRGEVSRQHQFTSRAQNRSRQINSRSQGRQETRREETIKCPTYVFHSPCSSRFSRSTLPSLDRTSSKRQD